MNRKVPPGTINGSSDKMKPKPQWVIELENRSFLVFEIATIIILIVLGYLLYGILSGQILTAHTLPSKDQVRIASNIATACKILWWSLIVWITVLALRNYHEETLGYLLLLLAAGLYYGVPMLLAYVLETQKLRPNVIVVDLANEFRYFALPAVVMGIGFVAADLVRRIQTSFERTRHRIQSDPILQSTREEAEIRRPTLLGKCWQLPYCERYIRERCPRYHERASCWRKKSGCMCDDTIVLKAMITDTANQATAQKMASLFVGKTDRAAAKRGKARCAVCPIFLEHQRQKHRLISPLVFPVAGVIFYEYLPYFPQMYHHSLTWMDKLIERLSFQATNNHLQAPNKVIANIAGSAPLEWIVLLCVLMIFITLMLQAVDLLIIRWKI